MGFDMQINTVEIPESKSNLFLSDMKRLPTLQVGEHTITLEIDDPSPEIKEIARKELRETPEVVEAAIKELKQLLEDDKDMITPHDKEAWLVRFLRPTKFYPESAYKLIKNYYSFKIKHKEIYDGLLPSHVSNVFEQNLMVVLPKRDQCGRRILVIALGKRWKHKKCNLDDVYRAIVLFMEAAMLEPTTQITGVQVIFDMDGLTLQQTWQFTPQLAKRIVDWLQDCVPVRVKGLHIVNQPYIFNMVFALFKPFLREKLKSRIIFHGNDRKSLHQHLHPDFLPTEYGGQYEIPNTITAEWFSLLSMCDKEYEAINSYGMIPGKKSKH